MYFDHGGVESASFTKFGRAAPAMVETVAVAPSTVFVSGELSGDVDARASSSSAHVPYFHAYYIETSSFIT